MSDVILGIHSFHDAGAALLVDGQVVAAASEERFSRKKHHCGFPAQSIGFVLAAAGVSLREVDAVAFDGIQYRTALIRFGRQMGWHRVPGKLLRFWRDRLQEWVVRTPQLGMKSDRLLTLQGLQALGYKGPVLTFDHHLGHAAYAYYASGLPSATVITLDGSGDWLAGTVYAAQGADFRKLGETYVHGGSMGHFYSAVTGALGFAINDGEGKTMALAAYGDPRTLREELRRWAPRACGCSLRGRHRWEVWFAIEGDQFKTSFGESSHYRRLGEASDQTHLAAAAQAILEEELIALVVGAVKASGIPAVAAAGGLFLNVKASMRILEEGPVEGLSVPPHPGDGGLPIGFAMAAHHQLTGRRPAPLSHPYLGPEFSEAEILKEAQWRSVRVARPNDIVRAACDLLLGGAVIGWFQGRMEWGPRALGARSVLADPRNPAVKDRINHQLKNREWFMPFAPSILADYAPKWFVNYHPSPYMNLAFPIRSEYRELLPAVLHVDGTARPHEVDEKSNPRYHALIAEFERRAGVPMILNTSFNRHGFPIVCSPRDAIEHLAWGCVDHLVIGPFVLSRT